MSQSFTYFDSHTHQKYKEEDIAFIRNAFHHLSYERLSALPYSFSIGIHPWDVKANYHAAFELIKQTATHPQCKAIGECGLDYFIKTDKSLQAEVFKLHISLRASEYKVEVFKLHIALAEQLQKPLIIHCVRAYHDLLPMLKNTSVPVVLHQYQGSLELTKTLTAPNLYFSFGKQLFRENFDTALLEIIPITQILFETDTMPMHIEEVYLKASTLLDVEFEELRQQVNSTAQKIF